MDDFTPSSPPHSTSSPGDSGPAAPPPASPPAGSPPSGSPPPRPSPRPVPTAAPPRRGTGIRGLFRSIFSGIDLARRLVVNLVFLFLFFLLVAWALSDEVPAVPAKGVLVVDPRGSLVEELSGDPLDRALDGLLGTPLAETLARDVVDALDAAADDGRIEAVVLDVDGMLGAGLSPLEAAARAVERFRESGKPVYATGDFYDKGRLYLASTADEIYLHELGLVLLDGYGVFPNYYRDGLERIEADWNVFRVGEYKSAVEPFLRDTMSEEVKVANAEWLGDLWRMYLERLAARRELDPAALSAAIGDYDRLLEDAGGESAELALELGLVDHVGPRDLLRERLIELVGEDESTHSFHQVSLENYVTSLGPREGLLGEAVAVVVARGPILDGSHPPGTVGGESTSKRIRDARHDDAVKAMVLRVDSGGGSTFASELIRRELELVREAGKPVVVSMGSVAASGGYWIATASDEIWADPTTITGSIGIYGMFPTFERTLSEHLGIHTDGVGTTWLSGALRPDRAMPERVQRAFQTLVDDGYEDFLERVAEAREMELPAVDRIAQGRVWSGEDAHDLGLVDELGGLREAIDSAAARAELGDDFRVDYREAPVDPWDQLLLEMVSGVEARFGPVLARRASRTSSWTRLLDRLTDDGAALALHAFGDRRGIFSYCFCEVE